MFGGCGEQGRLNDLWALETSGGLAWECLSLGGDIEGLHPSPRGGAALLALPGGSGSFDPSARAGQLVLLSGFDGAQRGDVWTFELDGSEGGWEDRTDDQQGSFCADSFSLDADSMEWRCLDATEGAGEGLLPTRS